MELLVSNEASKKPLERSIGRDDHPRCLLETQIAIVRLFTTAAGNGDVQSAFVGALPSDLAICANLHRSDRPVQFRNCAQTSEAAHAVSSYYI